MVDKQVFRDLYLCVPELGHRECIAWDLAEEYHDRADEYEASHLSGSRESIRFKNGVGNSYGTKMRVPAKRREWRAWNQFINHLKKEIFDRAKVLKISHKTMQAAIARIAHEREK